MNSRAERTSSSLPFFSLPASEAVTILSNPAITRLNEKIMARPVELRYFSGNPVTSAKLHALKTLMRNREKIRSQSARAKQGEKNKKRNNAVYFISKVIPRDTRETRVHLHIYIDTRMYTYIHAGSNKKRNVIADH